jgi:hypothetical protein
VAIQSGRIVCAFCQHLEAKLARLHRVHALTLENLRASAAAVNLNEYRRLSAIETDAKLELDNREG